MTQFSITDEQAKKLGTWLKDQNKKAVAKQIKQIKNPSVLIQQCWADGYPYGGAAGGALTYSFTPTSLGVTVTVNYAFTGEEIDLTNFEEW